MGDPPPADAPANAAAIAARKRTRFLRKCRDTDLRLLSSFVAQLAPTDHRGARTILRRADIQGVTDTHAEWMPRLVGRRLDATTLGAVLATPEAQRWPDQVVLALAQGRADAEHTNGPDHFARFVRAVSPHHPAGVARISLAQARRDPWSFLWQAEKLLAAGERTAVRVGLPAILAQSDGLLRERGLALIHQFPDVAPAPPASPAPAPTRLPRRR